MSALLGAARDQLTSAAPLSLRRACWLARAALEEAIDERLRACGIIAQNASERAKLSCLEGIYADQRELSATIDYAWGRLSEACHQHAYELSPTYAEVEHLICLVGEVSSGSVDVGSAG